MYKWIGFQKNYYLRIKLKNNNIYIKLIDFTRRFIKGWKIIFYV